MRRVRTFDTKTGEFLGVKDASEITSSLRYAFHYACLTEGCSKTYHWRKGYSREENTKETAPTFVENHTTAHEVGCGWDFEKRFSKSTEPVFFEGGFFHLRINFPLGGSWNDVNPRRGRLTTQQRHVAGKNVHIKGLSSMGDVVKFLEKEFGSIEAPELECLKLHYQGRDYLWNDIYTASDRYGSLVDVEQDDGTGANSARLTAVKILWEKQASTKGKRRFTCEWQQGLVRDQVDRIRPTLVCADDSTANILTEFVKNQQTALVSSRPFVPEGFWSRAKWQRGDVPVSLYIAKPEQIALIDEQAYWRYAPLRQNGLDFRRDRGSLTAENF